MSNLNYTIFNVLLCFIFVCKVSCSHREKVCHADEDLPWSYRRYLANGPKNWGERYEMCNGKSQSPINIEVSKVKADQNLKALELSNYDVPVKSGRIENNGHTVEFTPEDGTIRSFTISGSVYTLNHFHFHWGAKSDRGSEHTVNGKKNSMEAHFVHRNSDEQVAVIGVFFEEVEEDNTDLNSVVKLLKNVRFKNDEYEFNTPINLQSLVQDGCSYYRYTGSLTTPPCTEGVTWTVCKKKNKIGKAQIKRFRRLYTAEKSSDYKHCRMVDNYRPVQPLNGRSIYCSQ